MRKINIHPEVYRTDWHRLVYLMIGVVVLLNFWACEPKNRMIEMIADIQERNYPVNVDSSLVDLQKSDLLLRNMKKAPDSLWAQNNYLLGTYYRKRKDLESAAPYYYEATEYVKDSIRTKQEIKYFAWALHTYLKLEDYGNLMIVIEKCKEKKYPKLSTVYYYEEKAYEKQKIYEQALVSNQKRMDFLRVEGSTDNTINAALIVRGELLYKYGKKTAAFDLLDELIAKDISLSNNNKRLLYGNYGTYLFFDKKYEEALVYYHKGLSYTHAMKVAAEKKNKAFDASRFGSSYGNLAGAYIELKDYDKANLYLDSLESLNVNTLSDDLVDSYYKYRAMIAYETGQAIDPVLSALDSVTSNQRRLSAEKYSQDLEALKKSDRITESLRAENQRIEFDNIRSRSNQRTLAIVFLLSILAGFYFYRQRKKKFEQEALLMQQRLLRSQMSPHFIFNFLYVTQNQIRESPNVAIKHLTKFSRLLRLILENSMLNYVQLEKELDSLKKYMDLQRLRFPDKFTYQILLDNMEEDDFIFIPPMLLQPIVENCIEHGFANINYPGEIILRMHKEDKYISCIIEDNGNGLQKPNQNDSKESSAMRLISAFLKKTVKRDIEIVNKASLPEGTTGLQVKLRIPYKYSTD